MRSNLKDFLLSIPDISNDPRLKELDDAFVDRDKYVAMYEKYPNAIEKRRAYYIAAKNEPESIYKQGFLNLLNLITLTEFEEPYLSDRFNWYLIFASIYTKDKSYFEMKWADTFNPKHWRKPEDEYTELEYVKFAEMIKPNNDKIIFKLPWSFKE